MALTVTQLYEAARAGATSHTSTTFACAAGDLLVCIYTAGGASTDITGITDNSGSGSWTELSGQETAAHASAWWYKIANGSETTVTVSLAASSAADMAVVKITGWTGTPTLEGTIGEDESNTSTAATATIGAGSVTNTTANAIVLAFYTADGPGNIGISRSVSDGASYTEATDSGGDEQAYLYYHVKSATGTYSPVYSFTDTGDQVYGASAVFGDVSSGHSVSATTDALTLAEYAATIGKSLNITAGTDALTLAEYPATVGSVVNISATTDALTLAEYAATIGLSLNVQATTDALTLTEYPASLGSTLDVQATTDSLTLAEYAATIGLSLNVQAATDSLTLTEHRALITDASAQEETPAPSGGIGHKKKKYPRRVYIDGRLYTVKSEAEERRLLDQWRTQAQDAAAITENLGEKDLAQTIRKKAVRIEVRLNKLVDEAFAEQLRRDDAEILLFLDPALYVLEMEDEEIRRIAA